MSLNSFIGNFVHVLPHCSILYHMSTCFFSYCKQASVQEAILNILKKYLLLAHERRLILLIERSFHIFIYTVEISKIWFINSKKAPENTAEYNTIQR